MYREVRREDNSTLTHGASVLPAFLSVVKALLVPAAHCSNRCHCPFPRCRKEQEAQFFTSLSFSSLKSSPCLSCKEDEERQVKLFRCVFSSYNGGLVFRRELFVAWAMVSNWQNGLLITKVSCSSSFGSAFSLSLSLSSFVSPPFMI